MARAMTGERVVKLLSLEEYFSSPSEMQEVKAVMSKVIRPNAKSYDVITKKLAKDPDDVEGDYAFYTLQCSCVTFDNCPITLLSV